MLLRTIQLSSPTILSLLPEEKEESTAGKNISQTKQEKISLPKCHKPMTARKSKARMTNTKSNSSTIQQYKQYKQYQAKVNHF